MYVHMHTQYSHTLAHANTQASGLNPDASKWEVKDVGKWLESRGLHAHVKVFADNDVNGNLLLRLSKVGIKNMLTEYIYACMHACMPHTYHNSVSEKASREG
jgi:hypothetical protein